MPENAIKQERERLIIESARKYGTLLPPGTLVMAEGPDGRIPTATLGIEVSELLPANVQGARFSHPQLASFQSEVVREAARLFSDMHAHSADVLVFFKNDWGRRRNVGEMGLEIANFVANNYPQQSKTVSLQKGSRSIGWVEGLSVVRITAENGRWQAGGCSDVAILTYEQLSTRIAAKSRRLPEYHRNLPDWDIWLLLATRFDVLSSVRVPPEVESWSFTCDFDRVLLSSWDHGVLQLNCTKNF